MRSARTPDSPRSPTLQWVLLSNPADFLVCLAENHQRRLRDIAGRVGMIEHGAQKAELEAEGFLDRRREGRRKLYDLHLEQASRHPLEAHRVASDLANFVRAGGPGGL